MRQYARDANLSDAARADMIAMVDDHLKHVDTAVAEIRRVRPSYHEVIQQADQLREKFDASTAKWMEAHGGEAEQLQKQGLLQDAILIALTHDPDAILDAARGAGLPPDREHDAKTIVDDGHAEFLAIDQRAQKEQAAIAKQPDGDAKRLASDAIMADGQLSFIAIRERVYRGIRDFLPPSKHPKFDNALDQWLQTKGIELYNNDK